MFSKFFIERPIFAGVVAIVTVLLGVVALLRLPVAQYPDITPPTIYVTTSYPGASSTIVANTVGIPIEQQVNGVPGMLYMQSYSASDGTYTLIVTFEVGTDMDTAQTLVYQRVAIALRQEERHLWRLRELGRLAVARDRRQRGEAVGVVEADQHGAHPAHRVAHE